MKDELEKVKEELILKLNKLKQEGECYMKDYLRTEYDGYVAIYYTEEMFGDEFYTFEVYRANRLQVHETLDEKLIQEELDAKLKNYVKNRKEQERKL